MDFKPAQSVASGGIFHTYKVKYSPETAAFLNQLIEESKLSIFQRQELNKALKKGDPLPLPPNKTSRRKKPEPEVEDIKKILIPRRRKKDQINSSGAYDRERYIPPYTQANHDVEKKRLQDLMAFGKEIKEKKSKKELEECLVERKNKKDEEITKEKLFLTALEEIKERHEFYKKMEEMGKGKKYKEIIEQQIWEKLRYLEKIDKDLFEAIQKYLRNNTEVATLFN